VGPLVVSLICIVTINGLIAILITSSDSFLLPVIGMMEMLFVVVVVVLLLLLVIVIISATARDPDYYKIKLE